jgi:hypothetical protein
MNYFLNRIKEPSSWAGIAMLATLFGVPANSAQIVIQAVSAVAAAVAIFVPEKAA